MKIYIFLQKKVKCEINNYGNKIQIISERCRKLCGRFANKIDLDCFKTSCRTFPKRRGLAGLRLSIVETSLYYPLLCATEWVIFNNLAFRRR